MNKAEMILGTALLACVVAASGCVGNNYCAKRQECNNDLEDDSYGVCVESYSGNINALRANKEEECQVLADALLAFDACRASLDCDDFEEGDLGGQCDDELDDYEDAARDAEGECSSFD